jgi:hypothetical protein
MKTHAFTDTAVTKDTSKPKASMAAAKKPAAAQPKARSKAATAAGKPKAKAAAGAKPKSVKVRMSHERSPLCCVLFVKMHEFYVLNV